MRVPSSVNKLTIKQFIRLEQIKKQTFEFESDRLIKVLSFLTGVSVKELDNMPINKLKKYTKKVSRLLTEVPSGKRNNTIWIGFKRYQACKDENYLSTNQYTAIKHLETSIGLNIHKILSILYLRKPFFKKAVFNANDINGLAYDFYNKVKIGKVYGTLFFYSNKSETLRLISQLYSEVSQMEIQKHTTEMLAELRALGINTDGFISSIASQAEAMLKEKN